MVPVEFVRDPYESVEDATKVIAMTYTPSTRCAKGV
jgi:hypothetical protein